jgi:hypothetical protein
MNFRYFFSLLFVLFQPFCFAENYQAAGIIPYAFDNQNQAWILIGCEDIKNCQASDFGGGKDYEDNDEGKKTAAREGCEELLFIFDKDLKFNQLLNTKYTNTFNFQNSDTYNYLLQRLNDQSCLQSIYDNYYITYFIQINLNKDLPKLFYTRLCQFKYKLPFCWAEKTYLHWLKLSDVLNAINNNSFSIFDQQTGKEIILFKPFVESLKAAYYNGALNSLL